MISNGERSIYLALYLNKKGMHIREISRVTKLSLPNVIKHLNAGEKEGKIISEKKGQLRICRLNFRSPELIPVLQYIEASRFSRLPLIVRESVNAFIADLSEKPIIALIFGSFAKNTYSKRSDMDILLAFQRLDDELSKSIELSARKIRGRTGINIQPVNLGYKEFENEIISTENDFMKDVRENAMVLHGLEFYLRLIARFFR